MEVGRQIRIDEDIVGMDDEAVVALLWIGEHMLPSLEGSERRLIEHRIEMLKSERDRREQLALRV